MIEVTNLTRTFGNVRAVDDISFTVPAGRVVGFLGPNGAGKSTAMRCMVGLSRPDGGSTTILGLPYQRLNNPGAQVGVLLDASAQHDGRSGAEVLGLGAKMIGVGPERVDQMMGIVGLTPQEGKRRVGTYSLGMRQRLGIAHALLGNPQVLILDEPANGLDPGGIRWMRDLLRTFADQGGAVLLSSHLLHEIEHVADDLIVIGQGRIVAQGPIDQLLHTAGTVVRGLDNQALFAALASARCLPSWRPDGSIAVDAEQAQVGRVALEAGLVLTELRAADRQGLEELFLQLTAPTAREGNVA